MRIGYLECFAGISGDMLMAALVDAGAPIERLHHVVASLNVGAELRLTRVNRSGIQSAKIDVMVEGKVHEPPATTGPVDHAHDHQHEHPHPHAHDQSLRPHQHGRSLPQIRSVLLGADLTLRARELALRAFNFLAQAESRIHGVPEEEVHFHEVGSVDAIVDIACCAAALDSLAPDAWFCSPVNVGGGFVDCTHGRFPVPAPATAELLKEIPTYSAHAQMELVTPTGAALLRALHPQFDPLPTVKMRSIGYGAGSRNPERFPNVVRVSLGDTTQTAGFSGDKVVVLECAIDDLTPELLAHTAQLAMEQGALDVMSTPVTMKKGRLGALLTILAKPADAEALEHLIFRETTTLGIRVREENRVILARQSTPVETEFGVIHVKTGMWQGEEWNAAPEFEDCRRAAAAFGVPVKNVMQAAMAAWRTAEPTRS